MLTKKQLLEILLDSLSRGKAQSVNRVEYEIYKKYKDIITEDGEYEDYIAQYDKDAEYNKLDSDVQKDKEKFLMIDENDFLALKENFIRGKNAALNGVGEIEIDINEIKDKMDKLMFALAFDEKSNDVITLQSIKNSFRDRLDIINNLHNIDNTQIDNPVDKAVSNGIKNLSFQDKNVFINYKFKESDYLKQLANRIKPENVEKYLNNRFKKVLGDGMLDVKFPENVQDLCESTSRDDCKQIDKNSLRTMADTIRNLQEIISERPWYNKIFNKEYKLEKTYLENAKSMLIGMGVDKKALNSYISSGSDKKFNNLIEKSQTKVNEFNKFRAARRYENVIKLEDGPIVNNEEDGVSMKEEFLINKSFDEKQVANSKFVEREKEVVVKNEITNE